MARTDLGRLAAALVLTSSIASCGSGDGAVLTLASVAPESGSARGGDKIDLEGSGFGASPIVRFGGKEATITSGTDTHLEVVAPREIAGAVDVEVDADSSHARLAKGFTYLALPLVFVDAAWARLPTAAVDGGGAVIADVDGDGDQDLLQAVRSEGIWLYLNDGKGTFDEARATPLDGEPTDVHAPGGARPRRRRTARSLRGHDRPEAESTPARRRQPRLRRREDDGSPAALRHRSAGVSRRSRWRRGSRFRDSWNGAKVRRGAGRGDPPQPGAGVFSDVTEVRLAGGSFNASGVGDVDADGDQDLFFTADKDPCRLYLGDGHGAFQRAAPDAIPYDPAPGAGIPALGDLDGDGTLDVLDSCPDAPNPDQANLDSLPFRCASATSCLAETGCELRTFASSAYFVCKAAASSRAEASAACVARGGALVTVSSADENAFLLAAGVTDAWIGYTDAAVEGTFVWASGEGVFTSWGMAQPDDAGGNEDCATFLADGTWNDAPCDGKHAYVCEDLRARQPDPGDACDACPTAYEPGSVPVTLDGGVCGGTGGGGAGGGAP